MYNNRPVFLNVVQIKMPITAMVSFLHRVAGLVLFLYLPVLLWVLAHSLSSVIAFNHMLLLSHTFLFRFATWLLMCALGHHIVAGARHIFMDFGVGESMRSAQISAYFVLALDVLWVVVMGVWLW